MTYITTKQRQPSIILSEDAADLIGADRTDFVSTDHAYVFVRDAAQVAQDHIRYLKGKADDLDNEITTAEEKLRVIHEIQLEIEAYL